eukprot:2528002-Rhodomonas_salina.1
MMQSSFGLGQGDTVSGAHHTKHTHKDPDASRGAAEQVSLGYHIARTLSRTCSTLGPRDDPSALWLGAAAVGSSAMSWSSEGTRGSTKSVNPLRTAACACCRSGWCERVSGAWVAAGTAGTGGGDWGSECAAEPC